MFETSYLEISKSALKNNLAFIQKTVGKHVKISSVVKGNAYGHSKEVFIPIAEECGINHFSVFSAEEAYRLTMIRSSNADVMIMGMIDNEDIKWAIENKIEFFVFEIDRLNAALQTAKQIGLPARIHLDIETGMNRTGFNSEQLREAVEVIQKNKQFFIIEGVCTHYAGAESIANYVRVNRQIKKFKGIYKWLLEQKVHPKIRHTACSAAAMSYPQTRMDMVRIGIMQYGFWPSKETFIDYVSGKDEKEDPLKRIISWKSKVMSIKNVKRGEFIGYGTTYLALKDMKIATVPVGYSHGFSRSLSNQGRVLVHGQRASVIGTVNMNLITIDISFIPDVKKGDEVVLIGTQGDLTLSVASFSELSDLVNYELLTRLPRNIPRFVVD